MLEIGTQVYHEGHGAGTIVGYNGINPNEYAIEHMNLVPNELLPGIVNSFYSADRYPYIILFETGYQDVYGDNEISVGV